MKINSISFANLNSLRVEKTIDFADGPLAETGLFAIVGPTGSGKTTLLDAITLGIFGQVARYGNRTGETNEGILSYQSGHAFSIVEFEVNQQRYRSEWSIKRAFGKPDGALQGTKRALARYNPETDGFDVIESKVNDINKRIESLTGLDYSRFCRSVLLAQGEFAAFLNSDGGERSLLLEKLTGTEIYSQLSIAAHERHKLEVKKVEALQNKAEIIDLLSEEELNALHADKKAVETEQQTLATSIALSRKQLEWLQNKAKTVTSIEATNAELAVLAEAKPAVEALKKAYRDHQKVVHLEVDFHHLAKANQQLPKLAAQKTALETQIQSAQKQHAELQTKLTNQRQSLTEAKTEAKKLSAVIEQLAPIEREITTCQNNLAHTRTQEKALAEQDKTALQTIKTALDNLKGFAEQRTEIETWLTEHKNDAKLETELPKIEEQRHVLGSIYGNRKKAEAACADHEKKAAELNGKLDSWSKEAKVRQTDYQRLIEPWQEMTRRSIDELEAAIEQNEGALESAQLYSRQAEKQAELRRFETELAALKAEITALLEESKAKEISITDAKKAIVAAKTALDEAQILYEQQLRIVHYAADRAALSDGKPCPLCGSEGHNLEGHEFPEPQIEAATAQRKRAQQQLETAQEQLNAEQQKQSVLQETIRLKQGVDQQNSGSQRALEERVKTLSSQLKKVEQPPKIGIEQLQRNKIEWRALAKAIHTHNQAELAFTSQRATLLAQYRSEQEQFEKWSAQRTTLNAEWESASAAMNALLAPFGKSFTVGEKTVEQLQEQFKEFTEFKKRQTEIDRQQTIVAERLATSEKTQAALQQQQTALAAQERQLTPQLTALEQQYRQLWSADEKPQIRLKKHQEELEKAEASLEKTTIQTQQFVQQIKVAETELNAVQRSIQEAETSLKETTEKLTLALEKFAVSSIPELQQKLLTEGDARAYEHKITTHDRQQNALELQLTKLQKTLKTLAQEPDKPEQSHEVLTQLLNEQEQQRTQKAERIGSLQEKLATQEERRAQQVAVLQELKKQQHEEQYWNKLRALIGSADGKTYRLFAQGLTLDRLIRLANRHLDDLNGRYQIQQTGELDLNIIDTFQADHARNIKSLSGGETFLVSLALALGLSELAGQRSPIKSLFIDEGFGTLDADSLDLVINTLENLQSTGKTIGIISHVQALQERITTQIRLNKEPDGFSTVQIVA